MQLYKKLYELNKLETKRAPNIKQNKASYIITGVLLIIMFLFNYISSIMLLITYASGSLSQPSFHIVAYAIPFLLIYDLILRLSLPNSNRRNLNALFILPIPKKKVVLFQQLFIATGPLLFIWFLLFLPLIAATAFILGGYKMILFSTITFFLGLVLNKQLFLFISNHYRTYKTLTTLLFIGIYALLLTPIFYSKIEILNSVLLNFFFPSSTVVFFLVLIISLLLFCISIKANNKALSNIKTDEESKSHYSSVKLGSRITKSLGSLATQLQIDLNLFLRAKMMRQLLYIIPMFFGLALFTLIQEHKSGVQIQTHLLFSYVVIFIYFNFIGCEATFIEFYHTQKSSFDNLIKSKYLIGVLVSTVSLILLLIISLFVKINVLNITAAYTFVPGISSFIALQLYVYNKIAVNPHEKRRGNTSFNGIHFILIITACSIPPIAIAIAVAITNSETWGILLVIAINCIIAALSPLWIKNIRKRMMKRKHNIIEAINASRS